MTHGHLYKEFLWMNENDVILSGHTHKGQIFPANIIISDKRHGTCPSPVVTM